ncbi:MAG: alpha/beta hydrolase [Anaerolineae bacterium]|nr:alpha/beta hydrolase [Anaerolineae bacterium]
MSKQPFMGYKTPAGKQTVLNFYDKVLAEWPVPHETRTLHTRHGKTFVIVSGDPANPPLIMLHGASSNSMTWRGEVATLAQQYRVYAVDIVGEPGKSDTARLPFEGPVWAEWLDDVRAALDADPVTVVGLSWGGWLALKYAVTHPEHVTNLVLLTPGGVTEDNLGFLLRMLPLFMFGRWGQRRAMKLLFADKSFTDEVVTGMALIMKNFKGRRDVPPLFTDDDLTRLNMPVLLMGGDKDGLRDMEGIAARLGSLAPQLEVEIVPGAGHAILNVAPRIIQFLTQARDPALA